MATDLKPCPFCGGTPSLYRDDSWYPCIACSCGIRTKDSQEEIIVPIWNRRIGEHDEQEEEAAQEADREPEEEAGEIEEEDRVAEEAYRYLDTDRHQQDF